MLLVHTMILKLHEAELVFPMVESTKAGTVIFGELFIVAVKSVWVNSVFHPQPALSHLGHAR